MIRKNCITLSVVGISHILEESAFQLPCSLSPPAIAGGRPLPERFNPLGVPVVKLDRHPPVQAPLLSRRDRRRRDVAAVRPSQLTAKGVDRPYEHAVAPAKALDDRVLAATTSKVRRVIGVLLEDGAIVLTQALQLRCLTCAAARGVPGAEGAVKITLGNALSQVLVE
jgi:hypothetical protein